MVKLVELESSLENWLKINEALDEKVFCKIDSIFYKYNIFTNRIKPLKTRLVQNLLMLGKLNKTMTYITLYNLCQFLYLKTLL